jgi:CDP-ribitol ribitolphosphotransferase / teichoic acid ribitol-phosphate polymerase
MNNFKYRLFAAFFNFYRRLFKINKNRVSLIIINKDKFRGNLRYIYNELNRRDDHLEYNIISRDEYSLNGINSVSGVLRKIFVLLRLFLVKSYRLAVSRYIFLSDNFLPMAYMNLNRESDVVQIWHGPGAFKKFGLSSVTDPDLIDLEKRISEKLDYVVVSSKKVAPFYEEAFGVSEEKVLPLGIPRTDYYFMENDIEKLRKKFEGLYPESKDKKIVLYAPTFRENSAYDKDILENFDIDLFNQELGDQYILAVRLHPRINSVDLVHGYDIIDVTGYKDEKELLLIADILITDYSSIMVEYALLNKPIIFYPYDYKYYSHIERGFYFDYRKIVPGPVTCHIEELIEIIKNKDYDLNKLEKFTDLQFDYLDGNSTKRIVDYILDEE